MKFLCDRCKTRYSIGDDRVRGKILKIRCKNCANVITVREGMTDLDAADPQGATRHKGETQAVPLVSAASAGVNSGALGAAFASALTKPPAALEEEWYVSIDGDQDGPFSLADAQRWVASKAFDADLHCWSEGFDDWLPVDKVSHFRGLRKKPAPATIPPPLPRAAPSAGGGRSVTAAARVEDEPKPLFAATMASLEKSAPHNSGAFGLPPVNPSAARPSATPPDGERAMPMQARGPSLPANGSHGARVPSIPSGAIGAIGSNGSNGAALKAPAPPATPAVPSFKKSGPVPRVPTQAGPGTKSPAFDLGGDPSTQVGGPAFDEDAPASTKRPAEDTNDLFAKAMSAASSSSLAAATSPQMPSAKDDAAATSPRLANAPITDHDDGDDDDDLQIGEVSRVVNLADLRPPPNRAAAAVPRLGQTGAVPRLGHTGAVPRLGHTGAVPRLGQTGMVARIDDPNAPLAPGEAGSEVAPIPPPVAQSHKRHMIMLIGAAAAVLIGGVVAVVLLVGGDDGLSNLGRGNDIDTTRPDDPLRKQQPDLSGSAAANPFFPTKKISPQLRPNPNTSGGNQTKDPLPVPGGDKLGGDEIEAMARTQGSGTQRCYMRAQRGAEAIIVGDVKKVQATLTIGADGVVNTVTLDKHGDTTFGKCLSGSIKTWKFRTSPGGTFRIALQFVGT